MATVHDMAITSFAQVAMQTVFSHIIQSRFSQYSEDVATEALAYLLQSSDDLRETFSGFVRQVSPSLPALYYRTQQTEGSIRPDVWGFDDDSPRLLIENKFWAGLTDNQPVEYLRLLFGGKTPNALLFIVPTEREQTIRRELQQRVSAAGLAMEEQKLTHGFSFVSSFVDGTTLAITSWTKVLSVLEVEAAADPKLLGDVHQLRSLCDSADSAAFAPFALEQITDQTLPRFVQQTIDVAVTAVDAATNDGTVNTAGLRPQSSYVRSGRYLRFNGDHEIDAWFGVHFRLWRQFGNTPLWLVFSDLANPSKSVVPTLMEPWAANHGAVTHMDGQDLCVAFNLPANAERDAVIRSLADELGKVQRVLLSIDAGTMEQESD